MEAEHNFSEMLYSSPIHSLEDEHRLDVLYRQRAVTVETIGRVASQLVAYQRAYNFNISTLMNINDRIRELNGTEEIDRGTSQEN